MAESEDQYQGLKGILNYLLNEYKAARDANKSAAEPQKYFGKALRDYLDSSDFVDSHKFKSGGSAGQGNLNAVPWFGFFTIKYFPGKKPSAQSGFYVVYLLNEDGNKVYLTLNQGTSNPAGLSQEFKKGTKKKLGIFRTRASEIVDKIDNRGFSSDPVKDLGDGDKATAYAAGTILHKSYSRGQLPDEEALVKDLKTMLETYSDLLDRLENREFSEGIQAWIEQERVSNSRERQDSTNEGDQDDSEPKESTMNLGKNIILYGPPGTGKTYNTAIYAVAICDSWQSLEIPNDQTYSDVLERYNELVAKKRIAFTTFHQSYGYEEFIEGISPKIGGTKREDADSASSGEIAFSYRDGLFKEFCCRVRNANQEDRQPHVFIIDEINRGNISKIFGELITLIEESKREGEEDARSAKLPYTNEEFSVPNNIYLLGTMNTADRSIALMDTALRRRFQFIEQQPDSSILSELGAGEVRDNGQTLDVGRMLDAINERIELLYDREHTIGHAFFTCLKDEPTIDRLAIVFEKSVIPLLFEYFYEDYEKIRMVLGDNGKEETYQFITVKKTEKKRVFKGDVTVLDLPDSSYSVNAGALMKIESYRQIYSD